MLNVVYAVYRYSTLCSEGFQSTSKRALQLSLRQTLLSGESHATKPGFWQHTVLLSSFTFFSNLSAFGTLCVCHYPYSTRRLLTRCSSYMKFHGLSSNRKMPEPPILHLIPWRLRNLISQKSESQEHLSEGTAGDHLVQPPTGSVTVAKTKCGQGSKAGV